MYQVVYFRSTVVPVPFRSIQIFQLPPLSSIMTAIYNVVLRKYQSATANHAPSAFVGFLAEPKNQAMFEKMKRYWFQAITVANCSISFQEITRDASWNPRVGKSRGWLTEAARSCQLGGMRRDNPGAKQQQQKKFWYDSKFTTKRAKPSRQNNRTATSVEFFAIGNISVKIVQT